MKITLYKRTSPDLSRGRRLLAAAVCLCTGRGPYFHAESLMADGRAFTASPSRGSFWTCHAYPDAGWAVYDIGGTPAQEAAAVAHCNTLEGMPYAFRDALRLVRCPLATILLPRGHQLGHHFCSDDALAAAQYCEAFEGVETWTVDPDRLGELLDRRKYPRLQ